jgi:hypothetical protein
LRRQLLAVDCAPAGTAERLLDDSVVSVDMSRFLQAALSAVGVREHDPTRLS